MAVAVGFHNNPAIKAFRLKLPDDLTENVVLFRLVQTVAQNLLVVVFLGQVGHNLSQFAGRQCHRFAVRTLTSTRK